MINFGFTIKQARSEDLDKSSLQKYRKLVDLTPSFKRCFQCGNCSATCSARQFTDFSIRRVHTSFRRGEYDNLAQELRKCMLCGKCTLVCPRGVNTRHLILELCRLYGNSEGEL